MCVCVCVCMHVCVCVCVHVYVTLKGIGTKCEIKIVHIKQSDVII
jgi:hypothetical protein